VILRLLLGLGLLAACGTEESLFPVPPVSLFEATLCSE
jgi:hypothetical protein